MTEKKFGTKVEKIFLRFFRQQKFSLKNQYKNFRKNQHFPDFFSRFFRKYYIAFSITIFVVEKNLKNIFSTFVPKKNRS